MWVYLFAVCVIKHAIHDVLGQFGFIRVSSSAHPGVNNALIVCALKWHLQKRRNVRWNLWGQKEEECDQLYYKIMEIK